MARVPLEWHQSAVADQGHLGSSGSRILAHRAKRERVVRRALPDADLRHWHAKLSSHLGLALFAARRHTFSWLTMSEVRSGRLVMVSGMSAR